MLFLMLERGDLVLPVSILRQRSPTLLSITLGIHELLLNWCKNVWTRQAYKFI